MYKEDLTLEEILKIKNPQDRIERVKKLIRFDVPDLGEEIKNFLISQELEAVHVKYARFMGRRQIHPGGREGNS